MKHFPFSFLSWLLPFFLFAGLMTSQLSCTPTSSVRQKQIDRERNKKEQKAYKAYQADLKQHLKNQSKSTKKMMKKARREGKRVSPHTK